MGALVANSGPSASLDSYSRFASAAAFFNGGAPRRDIFGVCGFAPLAFGQFYYF